MTDLNAQYLNEVSTRLQRLAGPNADIDAAIAVVADSLENNGAVQAFAPALVRRSEDGLSTEVPAARLWSALLAVVPIALAVLVAMQAPHLEWVVVGGLALFGFAFAVNSSVHSYLILAYAGSEKAAEDVGFYYAANALRRFLGKLLSGLLYQWGGLLYALIGSALMLGICWLFTLTLPERVPHASGVHA